MKEILRSYIKATGLFLIAILAFVFCMGIFLVLMAIGGSYPVVLACLLCFCVVSLVAWYERL